jgi:GNAT superfamily N-acetyltransferase
MSLPQPFVRQYDPLRDSEDVLNVVYCFPLLIARARVTSHQFYTTIDKSVDFEPARTIGSYLWCKAYYTLTPSTCFALDDGSGRTIGYILGTPDTKAFVRRWHEMLNTFIDSKLIPPPGPDLAVEESAGDLVRSLKKSLYEAQCSMLLGEGKEQLLKAYPAHLHVNILPEYQGRGCGKMMINTFLERLRQLGAPGVHLGMVRSNDGARRFYERLGFELCTEVLDGGESGEVGRDGNAICLVKCL